ncbi:MAG: hypothetical protein MRZ84_01505 [Eubacterium sp.]|nr:hypothetical protein [Eubacterium sp.]
MGNPFQGYQYGQKPGHKYRKLCGWKLRYLIVGVITLAGFVLAVFGAGVAVGRLVEKIERLDRRKEDEEHKNTSKNDRR